MPRRRAAGLVLASAAVAAVLWLALWNSSQTQTGQITRIASISDWQVGYNAMPSANPYLWLTDHEILHFAPSTVPGGWDNAGVLDTRTDTTQSAPGLIYTGGGHLLGASPDGQWVLWNTQTFSSSHPGMAATRRSDGKTIRWPFVQTWGSTGFWLPDSRRWVCVNFVPTGQTINHHPVAEKRLVVYDVRRPGTQAYAIPGDTGAENILGVTPQGKVIFNDTFDGWGRPPGQAQPPLSLREVSLDSLQPTARIFPVQVPKTPPGEGAKMSLSPQGDRLLWTNFSGRPPSILGWISRLTHRSFGGGTESLDIWTCSLDGTAPHHVGTWSGSQMGFAACWNPDGKHISLTMQNELYSVSVP